MSNDNDVFCDLLDRMNALYEQRKRNFEFANEYRVFLTWIKDVREHDCSLQNPNSNYRLKRIRQWLEATEQ